MVRSIFILVKIAFFAKHAPTFSFKIAKLSELGF
jgi:hypothetical protein